MAEETTWIYGLKEEGSDEIRYVGASVDPIVRHRTHLRGYNQSKGMAKWMGACKEAGIEVEMVCLEPVEGTRRVQGARRLPEVAEAEDRWIVTLLDEEHRLINVRKPSTHCEVVRRNEELLEAAIERGRAMFGPQ